MFGFVVIYRVKVGRLFLQLAPVIHYVERSTQQVYAILLDDTHKSQTCFDQERKPEAAPASEFYSNEKYTKEIGFGFHFRK